VLRYFYNVKTDGGANLGLVYMGGHGHNWQAGVDAVERLIKSY
jgi:hypothetical protein